MSRRPWRWPLFLALALSEPRQEGYFDCSLEEGALQHGVKRAYRRLALASHPDKGGDGATAAELTTLRDSWLRDPLRFHVFRAMFEAPSRLPFGSAAPDGELLRSAAARVVQREGWPYLEVEARFEHGGRLTHGGSWSFAFGLKGVSTVHYRGDESAGGYDVCCDFQASSQCRRRPVGGEGEEEGQCRESGGAACEPYVVSDCPLPELLSVYVRRPLHLNSTGQWGAALRVSDEEGEGVACVALAFSYTGPGSAAEASASERAAPQAAQGEQRQQQDTDAGGPPQPGDGSAPSPLPNIDADTVSFKHLKTGSFCEDGADILEGVVDDYGGMDPLGGSRRADAESSMFYGSRCREKCRKRKACRFYTVYSSGWCQLSSRCAQLRGGGDPLTVTFAKVMT